MTTKVWIDYGRRIEWGTAFLASALLVYLHLVTWRHAGGLWRDEVVTLQVATMGSLRELWSSIVYDSFPGLTHLLLRFWTGIGSDAGDSHVRMLGLILGTGVIAALWLSSRFLSGSPPLLSLALLGFNTAVIRFGDSIRGYGLGLVLIVLAFGLIWKVIETPTPKWIALATLISILSVHSLYQNSFLLFAIFVGAGVVLLRHAQWKRLLLLVGIGGVAALSLVVYVGTIQRGMEIKMLMPYHITIGRIWIVIGQTLGSASMLWTWLGLVVVGVGIALLTQFYPTKSGFSRREKDLSLFCAVALLVGVLAFLVFLRILSLRSEPWNYLPLLGVVALSLEGLIALLARNSLGMLLRTVFAVTIIGLVFIPVLSGVQVRQTNIDLIAAKLMRMVDRDDLILVDPWYCGATFERYYQGMAPWTTLPPHEDLKLQRKDIFRRQMVSPNPIGPVLESIGTTLRSGNRVWLVGGLPLPRGEEALPPVLPAPNSPWGWDHNAYSRIWALQAGHFVKSHALEGRVLPVEFNGPVSPYENLEVVVVQGWQERKDTRVLGGTS